MENYGRGARKARFTRKSEAAQTNFNRRPICAPTHFPDDPILAVQLGNTIL